MEVNSRLMVVVGLMDEFNNRGGVLMLRSCGPHVAVRSAVC